MWAAHSCGQGNTYCVRGKVKDMHTSDEEQNTSKTPEDGFDFLGGVGENLRFFSIFQKKIIFFTFF